MARRHHQAGEARRIPAIFNSRKLCLLGLTELADFFGVDRRRLPLEHTQNFCDSTSTKCWLIQRSDSLSGAMGSHFITKRAGGENGQLCPSRSNPRERKAFG